MKQTQRIPFTEWAPDQSRQHALGGYVDLYNVYPTANGWRQMNRLTSGLAYGGGTNNDILSGGYGVTNSGVKHTYAGLRMTVIRASATSNFETVYSNSSATAAAAADGGIVDFVQWQNDMLFTNFVDAIQKDTDMAATTVSATALNAATDMPKCRTMCVSRNFLVLGYTHDTTDATAPQRVRWSAVNDPTSFTVSQVTQSDYEDLLNDNGPVMRVFGGEYVIVMQERGIVRMSYEGAPRIWRFDEISKGVGLVSPRAAVKKNNMVFFLSQDGFKLLVNGSELIDIGANKVDEYFFANTTLANRIATYAGFDPESERIFFCTDGSVHLVYDYGLNKWGRVAPTENKTLIRFAGGTSVWGTVLYEGKDTKQAGTIAAQIINLGPVAATPDASAATAYVELGFQELAPGRSAIVTGVIPWVRPKLEQYAASVSARTFLCTVKGIQNERSGTSESTAYSQLSPSLITGDARRFTGRQRGRYHSFLTEWTTVSGDYHDTDEITHLDVEFIVAGGR